MAKSFFCVRKNLVLLTQVRNLSLNALTTELQKLIAKSTLQLGGLSKDILFPEHHYQKYLKSVSSHAGQMSYPKCDAQTEKLVKS